MTESRNNEDFAEQAKTMFDDSVDRLDGATLSRLNQGRQQALAELHRSSGRRWLQLAPAAGVAAAAAVVVIMMNGTATNLPTDDAVTASDFEMLLEADSLEMLEDLEFFSLLDEVDAEPNGHVG